MKSIQTLQEEHLKRIANDKNAVIAKAIELSDVTYPLLVSHLLHLRKVNAVHNKIDEKNESAALIKQHNYICEHDLLYFLMATKQFELIREYFHENERLAQVLAVINEIEDEEKKAANKQQYLLTEEANKKALQQGQSQAHQSHPIPQMKAPDGLDDFLQYQYYDGLLKNLTYNHHLKRAAIYDEAYVGRMARMNDLCHQVLNNPTVSREDKKALWDMRREYHQERNRIMNMPVINSDGSPNFKAAEERDRQMEELDKHNHRFFSTYMENMANKSSLDPGLREKFKEHLHKEREEAKFCKEKINKEDQQYEKDAQEILAHMQRTLKGATAVVEGLITDINKIPLKDIPESQREQYIASLSRLNELKDELKQTQDPARQKELLAQCTEELDVLKTIVEPVMKDDVKQQFAEKLERIHQVVDLKNPSSKQFTAQNTSQKSDEPSFSKPHTTFSQEAPRQETKPTPPHTGGTYANNSGPTFFATKPSDGSFKVQPNSEQHDEPPSFESQRQFKVKLQQGRPPQEPMEATDDLESANHIEVINALGEELLTKIDELTLVEEFSEDDLDAFAQLTSDFNSIKKYFHSNDIPEELKSSIQNNMEQLCEGHGDLDQFKKQLEKLVQAPIPLEQETRQQTNSFH